MKKIILYFGMLIILVLVGTHCNPTTEEESIQAGPFIAQLQKGFMNVVSEDLFPPPVASRIYAYTHWTAFEALAANNGITSPFKEAIYDFKVGQILPGDPYAAYLEAFILMGKQLVYRDPLLEALRKDMILEYGLDTTSSAYQQGRLNGQEIQKLVSEYAKSDGYDQSRNLAKYSVNNSPGSWKPTAPTFGEALEPYWGTLRPFFMDSANQFRASLGIDFDTDPNSAFYKQAMEVQGYVSRANEDSVAVAVYWDCNPGPTMLDGHFMQVRKQNTPGGHWLGITAQMILQRDDDLEQGAYLMALIAMGIADGFICAWDTKYAFDLLRPETYINEYMDSDWRPKLESPLFPEYSSAHSIISAVSASLLTEEIGSQVAFTDSTNVSFGYPPRSFDSFWAAAQEAATSRLLGGIHYPFACRTGLEQGKEIGDFIISRMKE